jgi:glutamyl-tRNA synthetase
MTVVTRFAPSPTGDLHIGGARVALFNWLFSRHEGGKFFLRIEDTDRVRSTPEAEAAIIEGLRWLGLDWDGDTVFQFSRAQRHRDVAYELLDKGLAYRCYTTTEELQEMREKAKSENKPFLYDGRWRDCSPEEAPSNQKFALRLKASRVGETILTDLIQGTVSVKNAQLDDMVLLRADGTPTYMLSVVVDDHDMGVTHVIRGDDHLSNTFRQMQIYQAMNWALPQFAHVPLIHGSDGAKLSKRHGAMGVQTYQEMGFLPEAMKNYLLRLGWGHGNTEIISEEEAIQLFSLDHVGRSPSCFDWAKLTALNAHYLRERSDASLFKLLKDLFSQEGLSLDEAASERVLKGLSTLKQRAKTLLELKENAEIYRTDAVSHWSEEAKSLLEKNDFKFLLEKYLLQLEKLQIWAADDLEKTARLLVQQEGTKLGHLAQPLRALLTGSLVSPPVFHVMEILGRSIVLERLRVKAFQ